MPSNTSSFKQGLEYLGYLDQYFSGFSPFVAAAEYVKNSEYQQQIISLVQLLDQVRAGTANPQDLISAAIALGFSPTEDFQNWLNNQLSVWNTQQSQNWQEEMRDTSITSTAEQYAQLGLSGSNVLQGSLAATPNSSAAFTSTRNTAADRADRALSRTRTMVGMISGLMSAGVGGSALYAARKYAADSALKAVKTDYKAAAAEVQANSQLRNLNASLNGDSAGNAITDDNWSTRWDELMNELVK